MKRDPSPAQRDGQKAGLGGSKNSRAWSLRQLLSIWLATVVLVTGGVVGSLAWWEARQLMLDAADQAFRATARHTEEALHDALVPVARQLESLAIQRSAQAADLAGAHYLRQILENEPEVDAVYAALPDGGFFLLRAVRGEAVRAAFKAPEEASFVAQSLRLGERQDIFFNSALEEIGRAPPQASSFDARERPWYKLASQPGVLVTTEPYVFFTTREPGITLAVRNRQGVVIGADISLVSLSRVLADLRSTPSMHILLVDAKHQVLARARLAEDRASIRGDNLRLERLSEFKDPLLEAIAAAPASKQMRELSVEGSDWKYAVLPVHAAGSSLELVIAAPVDELVAGATQIRNRSLGLTAFVLAVGLVLALGLARRFSERINALADEARSVREFDFTPSRTRPGWTRELNQLGDSIELMKSTIRRFLEITASLASERELGRLIGRVAEESSAAVGAQAVSVWLPEASGDLVRVGSESRLAASSESVEARAWRSGQRALAEVDGQVRIAVPLSDRGGERVGVLSLIMPRADSPGPARLAFVEQLAGASAVAIETRRLLDERKALLDAFIRVLAGAIDAKSSHTGAHCQRVPELTLALARAACEARQGPFANFSLDANQWEALEIASWLHDCGKVTTPDFVIDKATKLEAFGDRLHEVRMRFEVLKRDAEIAHWQRVAAGEGDLASRQRLESEWAQLDEDFAFVAACNTGGESLSPEAALRLREIAARRWQRTLDDRIGLSPLEAARREARSLPVWEDLLADRPEHRIERSATEEAALERARRLGMKMPAPEFAYDHGELRNLLVARGTLTEEERYLINHHIVQTILMLEQLPLPRHLATVPEFAGGHHERVDGHGYPKGLDAAQLSLPARMMAIADVFEALTASDRPYKPGKPLTETLALMAKMSRSGHLDPQLFDLFLDAGVWLEYARRFLKPAQIDLSDPAAARRWLASEG